MPLGAAISRVNCILANMELPEGFTARPLVRSDIDDVYAVAEAYDIEMLGEPGMEKADIEGLWKMPNFHLDTDSLGVFDGPRLMAYAEVFMGKYVELCVNADYRGRGLGTVLAQWSEDRLRDMGAAKAIQSAPRYRQGRVADLRRPRLPTRMDLVGACASG